MKLHILTQCVCIGILLGSAAESLRADAIEYNYGPVGVNFLTGGSVDEGLQGFNPALGTLSSVEVDYSASAVILQGDALSSDIDIYLGNTLLGAIDFPTMDGRDEQTKTGSLNIPAADLTDFENAGTVGLTFTPFTACRGTADTPSGCSEFTANVSGDVVYSYTPAPPAAPEPASFLLLGAGLIGVGMFRRRA